MLDFMWHLSLKTEFLNGKKYSNINSINHPLTVLFINQVDKDIFSSQRDNMTFNSRYISSNRQNISNKIVFGYSSIW